MKHLSFVVDSPFLTPYLLLIRFPLTPACLLATDCYVLYTLREERLLARDRGGPTLSPYRKVLLVALLSLSLSQPSAP